MSVKSSKDISIELLRQSNEAQANPKEIFGIANFGTDWPILNKLSRGLQHKTFTVLMARPKVGKSMLVSQWVPDLALQAQEAGKVLRIVTLETTMTTYQQRTASQLAGIRDPLRIRAGYLDAEERKRYKQALKTLHELPIEYLSNEYDMTEEQALIGGYSAIGLDQIEQFIRQQDTFLWVIDHMGLINRKSMGKGPTEQLEAISNRLAILSTRYVGGIGITHLNRNSLDGGVPSFENIAGTDVFARDPGALYFLWRPFFESRRKTPEDLEMMEAMGGDPGLLIFKSRNEGDGSVGLFWSKEYASFTETDKREGEIPLPGGGRPRRGGAH
jgi:replicative DNA helicase